MALHGRGLAAMALSFCAMSAAADTYVLDAALSGRDDIDWTVSSSYSGTYPRDPAANDTVEIPAGMVAKVTAGSASWTLVNTLTRIVPKDGSVFEVNVPADHEGRAVLSPPVTEHGISGAKNSGTLRKTGAGALELASYGNVKNGANHCDYYINIAVDGGDLHLCGMASADTEQFAFIDLTVNGNATLHLCNVGQTRAQNLHGAGFVTLDNADAEQRLFISGTGTSSFGGWMTGRIRVDITAGRHDITCKTNTIDTICLSGTGICGFTRLGANSNAGTVSSLGAGNFNFGSSSGIVYLGDEDESSSKTFWLGTDTFLDAGAHGGLTLSGKLDSSGSSVLRTLTLCGDNANACVISGTFPGKADQKNVFYLRKRGSGTWRMGNSSVRGSLGVIDVEEGTLQFDSIAEKGSPCSLGYATNLFARVADVAYANGTPVGYAMVLGGDGTEGTLEYMGNAATGCVTRPLAIRSKGRFKATGAAFALSDAYALGVGEKTLTLDGDSSVSTATGLSDGTDGGRLSVVKEGSGTWDLCGTNTFTGPLVARGGVMRVHNFGTGMRFRWYRICITENIYGSSRYTYNLSEGKATVYEKAKVQLLEIALYDSNGVNLLSGFTTDEPISIRQCDFDGDYSSMPAGTVALGTGTSATWSFNQTDGQLYNLFDNRNTKVQGGVSISNGGIYLNRPSTWLPIVVRLPDDAGEAVRIDFLGSLANTHDYNGRCPTAYRLDGSVDGVHWDIGIAQDDALEPPGTAARWYSDPGTSVTYGTRPNKGFAFDQTAHIRNDSHAFSAVGAADGGVLEVLGEPLTVSGLVVDASAPAGTISNIVFAATGTVDVQNAEIVGSVPLDLPGDYSQLAGVENMARWNVMLDGEPYLRRKLAVRNGRLSLNPKALVLSFR